MPGSNNLHFLQALGWATLNSIWQMALLWLAYLLFTQWVAVSSFRKYLLAAGSIFMGFAWFLYTLGAFYFLKSGATYSITTLVPAGGSLLPMVLSSASLAYLALLLIPILRLVRSWRYIRQIKREGMQKISCSHRLFVDKYSHYLGIGKTVRVYLSSMVSSPVTLGFLKPVILLPLSVVSNLSTSQVEAILLHELTHIRRHDYLVNLVLNMIYVVLYFNPFVRFFLKSVELERENCCDEMVLQFQYDKVSYASALLQLERTARQVHLAMAAANRNHLLNRVETIVGLKRKQQIRAVELGGIVVGLFMFLLVNALLFNDRKAMPPDFTGSGLIQPSAFFVDDAMLEIPATLAGNERKPLNPGAAHRVAVGKTLRTTVTPSIRTSDLWQPPLYPAEVAGVVLASVDVPQMESLDVEQQAQVKETVAGTRKVLELQWKEVNNAIADGMTPREKKKAKQEYFEEIENIDWTMVENRLANNFNDLDWNRINGNVSEAIVGASMDSLENCYKIAIEELEKSKACPSTLPMPDVSQQEVIKTGTSLRDKLKELQRIRSKKVVRL